MRKLPVILIASLLPLNTAADLGETEQQVAARYGRAGEEIPSGDSTTIGKVLQYKVGAAPDSNLVKVWMRDGKSQMEMHFSFQLASGGLRHGEIDDLRRRNAEHSSWILVVNSDEFDIWQRSDGKAAAWLYKSKIEDPSIRGVFGPTYRAAWTVAHLDFLEALMKSGELRPDRSSAPVLWGGLFSILHDKRSQ